jgi:hypothetical protein
MNHLPLTALSLILAVGHASPVAHTLFGAFEEATELAEKFVATTIQPRIGMGFSGVTVFGDSFSDDGMYFWWVMTLEA